MEEEDGEGPSLYWACGRDRIKVSNEWFCRPLEKARRKEGRVSTKPASASFLEDWVGSPRGDRKHPANTSAPSLCVGQEVERPNVAVV